MEYLSERFEEEAIGLITLEAILTSRQPSKKLQCLLFENLMLKKSETTVLKKYDLL